MEFNLKLQSFLGIFVFIAVAWLMSEDKKIINLKSIIFLLITQIGITILIVFFPFSESFFIIINNGVMQIQRATEFGTSFVFGYLGGAEPPFQVDDIDKSYILAFRALPLIIVVSAISSVLFYIGLLQRIIRFIGKIISYMTNMGHASAFGAAANVFVGMVEAPLLIKPYLDKMSRSDLFVLMTTGMCTIAGTVFALYVSVLENIIPNIAVHLILSSVLSLFSGVMLAQIMIPPLKQDNKNLFFVEKKNHLNIMDAVSQGTSTGLSICLNVVATLIVMLSLVFLINSFLSLFSYFSSTTITLQQIFGLIFAPFMWFTGMNWSEALITGELMGTKTVFNEFLAFLDLSKLESGLLNERSTLLTVYALSGFANFGSLGIMMTGLISLAPNRRTEILELGPKSLVSATLATLSTASIVGIII